MYPSRESLLNAFAFLSEYNNVFSELIEVYSAACKVEQNIHVFKKLLRSFYINASAHDYDVFIALKEICKNNKQKLNVINKIEQEFREEVDIKLNFH